VRERLIGPDVTNLTLARHAGCEFLFQPVAPAGRWEVEAEAAGCRTILSLVPVASHTQTGGHHERD